MKTNKENRINTLNTYLKSLSLGKVVKLAIDGGFTCPNRDGKLSSDGCTFCSDTGSGDYAGDLTSVLAPIKQQVSAQKALLGEKWPNANYIAYFQNYSNTYGPIHHLKNMYDQALDNEGLIGLAIATRSDCLPMAVIDLLKDYNQLPVFWVEIGLQTLHLESHKKLNTHFELQGFEAVYHALSQAGIKVVLHLIAGLPNETHEDFMASVAYVAKLKPFGVKIQMLNVLKNTKLAEAFLSEPFELLDKDTYIEWVVDALEVLPEETFIHRMTGDGPKDLLIAPNWIKNKRAVLNGIQQRLKARDTYQGKLYRA